LTIRQASQLIDDLKSRQNPTHTRRI